MQMINECYLSIDEDGNPIIGWKFDDEDLFYRIGKDTCFLNVSREGEKVEQYMLAIDYLNPNEYSITIMEESDNVLIKVAFDAQGEFTLAGKYIKDQGFYHFMKAYDDGRKSNIMLHMILNKTQSKKRFYTFSFTKNQFSTVNRLS